MADEEMRQQRKRRAFMQCAKHPTLNNVVKLLCMDVSDILKGVRK